MIGAYSKQLPTGPGAQAWRRGQAPRFLRTRFEPHGSCGRLPDQTFSGPFSMRLSIPHSMRIPLLVTVVGYALAGCTTVETQSFRVPKNSTVESAQISTTADFSRYDRLMAEDMGIYFPSNSPSTAADVQRIRQIFRTAFLAELEGYEIVREPGPGAMAVQASLIDLRNSGDRGPSGLRSDVREMAVPGSLVFLMELKDSQTGEVLARAADSTARPAFATGRDVETDWQTVEEAAGFWASLFRRFLDENLGS